MSKPQVFRLSDIEDRLHGLPEGKTYIKPFANWIWAGAIIMATYKGYRNVPYQSAQATASVMVWKDAFERANSFDTKKVRDALSATKMKTFYGSIEFAKAGNNIAKPMVLRQIQNGKLVVVAPSKWASHPVNSAAEFFDDLGRGTGAENRQEGDGSQGCHGV